ncbi:hypothetical protein KKD19_05660 [Patescibacteria group bacterium]|nr:hypothetical protein [Patescibacteria group bacterium]MCG2693593.1 hypothetical protein [Candidatus Parcubacteria bacterium]
MDWKVWIGKGIAIVGIWLGVGISSFYIGGDTIWVALFATFATVCVAIPETMRDLLGC